MKNAPKPLIMIGNFLHNVIAHPLLFFSGNAHWAIRFHDWTAEYMCQPPRAAIAAAKGEA